MHEDKWPRLVRMHWQRKVCDIHKSLNFHNSRQFLMDLLSQMLTDLVAWCWRWTTWLAPTIRTCSCSEWWPRISNRRPGFGRGASGRGTHGAGGGTRFGPSPCWLFRPVECSTSNCSKCCFPDRQSCGPTREIDQFKIKSIPSLKSSIIWSDFFQLERERL